MPHIFISYRHSDWEAARILADDLADLGFDVFLDSLRLEAGQVWPNELQDAVQTCRAMLVVVGKGWTNWRSIRRLKHEGDWVRREVHGALVRGPRDVLVIPVLVEPAKLPGAERLPEELRPLLRLQHEELTRKQKDGDVKRLAKRLHACLGTSATPQAEPIPEMLPYLCDRDVQEGALNDYLNAILRQERTPICVVHGHGDESHNDFLRRVKPAILENCLGATRSGLAEHKLVWPTPYTKLKDCAPLLRQRIKQHVLGSTASDEQLTQYLKSPGQPQVLVLEAADDDLPQGGRLFVENLASAWQDLFRLPSPDGKNAVIVPSHPFLLWVNLRHYAEESSLVPPGTSGRVMVGGAAVLPALAPIGRPDIDVWLDRPEVRPFVREKRLQLQELVKSSRYRLRDSRLRMSHFAHHVQELLGDRSSP